VHNAQHGCDWCFCTAWWVPTWSGWGERSAAVNLRVREQLLESNISDGYLLFRDSAPLGWAQVFQRDAFPKLVAQFQLEPAPTIMAITCFLIIPEARNQGLGEKFLRLILERLKEDGYHTVQAFPKAEASLPPEDQWTGRLNGYLRAGFQIIKTVGDRHVVQFEFNH